ncbi:MAG TPA: signal peptidase I [Bacilli bacterium]
MIKKIIAYIISVLTTLCFLFTLVIIIIGIKANQNKNIVKIFGYSFSVVATDSMEPTIKVGEIITIKSVPFSDIEEGNIIVFWSQEYQRYICHRVVDIEDGKLFTKGDNPRAGIDKEFVTEKNYFGVVRSFGKYLNIGIILLQYRDVVYGLIIFLFAIVIVKEIVNIVNNVKKAKEEELKEEARKKLYAEAKEQLRRELMEERGEK